ncbi:MAG: ribose ABC transporter permease, partial [Spirochaetota bacterium]
GGFIGAVVGVLIAYVKLPPFIVTLGGLTSYRGAAFLLANGTTIINNDLSFAWIANTKIFGISWLIIISLLLVLLCWFLLKKTVFGIWVYSIGGNMEAARLTGIPVRKVLVLVYMISGLCAGLAGVMISSRLYSANGFLGNGAELDAIAAVILGGTSFVGGIGGIGGTLIGALIIGILDNGLTLMQVSDFWQSVIKGLVIVVAVIVDKLRNRAVA